MSASPSLDPGKLIEVREITSFPSELDVVEEDVSSEFSNQLSSRRSSESKSPIPLPEILRKTSMSANLLITSDGYRRRRSENDAATIFSVQKKHLVYRAPPKVPSPSMKDWTSENIATSHKFFVRKLSYSPQETKVLLLVKEADVLIFRNAQYQVTVATSSEDLERLLKISDSSPHPPQKSLSNNDGSPNTYEDFHLLVVDKDKMKLEEFHDFVKKLRWNSRIGDNLPILLLSDEEMGSSSAKEFFSDGVDDMLFKPYSSDGIKVAWRSIWRKRKEKLILDWKKQGLVLYQAIESEVEALQTQLESSINSPIDLILRNIAKVMRSQGLDKEEKRLLGEVLFTLKSTPNLYYRPELSHADGRPIDQETHNWLLDEIFSRDATPSVAASVAASVSGSVAASPKLEITAPEPKRPHGTKLINKRAVKETPHRPYSPSKLRIVDDQSNRKPRRRPPPALKLMNKDRALEDVNESANNNTTSPKSTFFAQPSPISPLTPLSVSSPYSIEERMNPPFMNIFTPDEARLALLDNWSFDVWSYTTSELIVFMLEMFHGLGLMDYYHFDISSVISFLKRVSEEGYGKHQNSYHTFFHAFDVTHAGYLFMKQCGLDRFEMNEKLAYFLACICHDMGHDGHTNNYHIAISSDVALRYNDRSVLENHHAYETFRLFREYPATDFLFGLSPDVKKEVRSLVIKLILATDMGRHMEILEKFQRMTTSFADQKSWRWDDKLCREAALEMLMKCADVSNAIRPIHLAKCWSDLIQEEMFQQGDQERQLGLTISAFGDRQHPQQAKLSTTFADFIVLPLFQLTTKIFPRMAEYIRPLLQVREYWQMQQLAAASGGEEGGGGVEVSGGSDFSQESSDDEPDFFSCEEI